MVKPRTKNGSGLEFPFIFEKNGRTGRIKKWGDGKFGTYFVYGGQKRRNSFASFNGAYEFLERTFTQLDSGLSTLEVHASAASDMRNYSELKQILREQADGATLRDAVDFFLAHRQHKRFSPLSVAECVKAFLAEEKARNLSPAKIKTLVKHLGRFNRAFGPRKIHEIAAREVSDWLAGPRSDNGEPWSPKTRRNVRGSLVSLSLYAQGILKAIPDVGKTEFQKIKNPKKDVKGEVEIYSPERISKLLRAAIEHDIDLIPGIVFGSFEGLRPDEFHAENARDEAKKKRRPLSWDAVNWQDDIVHVSGQKVRSKATRDIPLHPVARAWLEPFRQSEGEIWQYKRAFDDKMKSICTKASVERVYDGFRHSYASYRIRQLKGDLAQLAAEMGNSPAEIVSSYKRNVTDRQAAAWFGTMPPAGYAESINAALKLRNT